MDSIRKKAAIGEEEGRHQLTQFSDLPDEILIRILSMLPTKDAVRTCLLVLSRSGQQHLWKSLTRLEFDDNFNFVDKVMDLRDFSSATTLVSFSLQCCAEDVDEIQCIETWIAKAVQCNVEELTLQPAADFFYDVMIVIPSCLFGCQSLVKLDLKFINLIYIIDTSDICLPRLKYLRLCQVRSPAKSMEKLLSSPLLEELILDKCKWYTQSISACSPKLRVLKISEKCKSACAIDRRSVSKLCINGDNLESFFYMGRLQDEYQICASTQLSKVEIYVNDQIPEDGALNCYNILKGLSGTRNLTLSDYFLEGLQNSSELLDTIPIFEALTQLNIRVYYWKGICIDSLALMKMYERCPHLDYLNIGQLSLDVRRPQLSPVPLCFRTHLKKILVHYYVPGDEDEDEADAAIDMLLNSAFTLEELVIYCKRNKEKGFHEGGHKIQELQDKLNRRPRVSKDCIISVREMIRRSSASWK